MEIWKRMRVTRVTRLKMYLENLEKHVEISNKKDLENIDFLKNKMKSYFRKMGVFSGARTFFYVVLYASVVANFIGDMATPETTAFVSRFASPIMILGSILGTTLSLGYILLFSKFVNIYWEDVRTISSNMIAIYTKYDTHGVALDMDIDMEQEKKQKTEKKTKH